MVGIHVPSSKAAASIAQTQTTGLLVSAPACRSVRIGMLVNGNQVGGLKGFTVTSPNFFSCDTWSATIGLQGTPTGYGAAFWSLQTAIEVQLQASLTDGGALSYVTGGFADKCEINLASQTMTIRGRDYSAALIDATTNEKFVNQTSSQVATTLATRRGLIPQVTATTTPIGRYIDNEYSHVTDDVSEFRLLSYLAQQEGFDLYARGKTLVFSPPVKDASPIVMTYESSLGSAALNAPEIVLTQDKTLSGIVTVQVRSWNYQQGAPVIATWQSQKTSAIPTAGRAAPKPGASYTRAQEQGGEGAKGPFYIVRRSGLTQQQADQLAQKTLADITANERSVDVSGLPAILSIDPRRTLRLTGTGTAYDQDYTISEIERQFGWDSGATMSVKAQSASPQTLITI